MVFVAGVCCPYSQGKQKRNGGRVPTAEGCKDSVKIVGCRDCSLACRANKVQIKFKLHEKKLYGFERRPVQKLK